MVHINFVQRYVQLINVIDKTINLLRVDGLDINLPKMRCWKGSEEFSSNPGLLLFEDVFPSCSFFFLFCCKIFSVWFWLFNILKHTIHLCKLWPNLNYCHLFSVTIDKNWKDIKHVLISSHFWLALANQSFFWMYIEQKWYAVASHSFSLRYKNADLFLASPIDIKWFEVKFSLFRSFYHQ